MEGWKERQLGLKPECLTHKHPLCHWATPWSRTFCILTYPKTCFGLHSALSQVRVWKPAVFFFSKGTIITAGPFLMAYCNQPRLRWWRWLLVFPNAYVHKLGTGAHVCNSRAPTARPAAEIKFLEASVQRAWSVLQWVREPVSRWKEKTSMCTCKHARAHVHPKNIIRPHPKNGKSKNPHFYDRLLP